MMSPQPKDILYWILGDSDTFLWIPTDFYDFRAYFQLQGCEPNDAISDPDYSFLVSTYIPRSHRNRRGSSAPAEIRKSGFHKISQELLSLVDSWSFKGHSEQRDIPWQELAQKLMDLPSNGKNKHVCLPSSKVLFRFRQIVYLIKY